MKNFALVEFDFVARTVNSHLHCKLLLIILHIFKV